MREIKFRAWDEESKTMTNRPMSHDQESINNFFKRYELWRYCHIMQYTGLKDKNGVEIYDGDVLAFDSRAWYGGMYSSGIADYVFKVEQSETGEWVGAGICTEWSTHCEVIGNIYENPELLENK